jgi:uncharacterized protein (TIGR02266 family)
MSENKLTEAEKNEIRTAEELKKREDEILQRQSQRLRMEAKLTLRSQTNFFMGFSENISEGGIFISTESPPDVGDAVEVDIPMIDGSQTVSIKGIVRWHRFMADGNASGCGVQFTEIPDGAERHLENMITMLQKEPLFIDL